MVIDHKGGPGRGGNPVHPLSLGLVPPGRHHAGRHSWKLLNQRLTRKRGRRRRRHPSTETAMSIGSSLDVVSSRRSRPRGQRGRGLSKESHDGHFKFKSPNAVPATLFVPANVQHAAPGPPWTMAHASRMALQDTKELCQCSPPPAAQIKYPTRAGLITEPAHAHTRMSALETLLAEPAFN